MEASALINYYDRPSELPVLVLVLTGHGGARCGVLISGPIGQKPMEWRVIARQESLGANTLAFIARTAAAFDTVTGWCEAMELIGSYELMVGTGMLGTYRESDMESFAAEIFRDIPVSKWAL